MSSPLSLTSRPENLKDYDHLRATVVDMLNFGFELDTVNVTFKPLSIEERRQLVAEKRTPPAKQ